MKAIALALTAALCITPVLAQQQVRLDGQWHARVTVNGNTIDTVVVINGQQYSMTVSEVTAQGYTYGTFQSGQFFFTPPNHMGFVVLDWSPKDYEGHPQMMPGNSNVSIVQGNDKTLLVTDDLCMQQGSVQQCSATFYREL
jgi:uncharacterized protein YdeI (BOF family)